MTIEDIRKEFPILSESVYGKPLVYLDNAATSQRPLSVVRKWDELSLTANANIHRAVHKLAVDATNEYESSRVFTARFLNAPGRENIVFTSGTTAAINLVAYCFGERFISEGDEIIVSEAEHHSNIVPWQLMCSRKKAKIKVLPVNDRGELAVDLLEKMISTKTRIVCVAHVSNVLGIVNPVKEIVRICHSHSCPVLIDGAQGVVHGKVDVQDLDCDFYTFSGHKLYAAPGTGVLYAKKQWLEDFPPYMGGGEMIDHVSFQGSTFAPVPGKFEAGTQNLAGTPTLIPALTMAEEMRGNEEYSAKVNGFVFDRLENDSRIRIFGVPEDRSLKTGIFSFAVEGAHHEDLALILDKMGVAVRSGQMCAEPLMDRFGVTGMLRASFAPYNTLEEAEIFINSLDKAIKMLV